MRGVMVVTVLGGSSDVKPAKGGEGEATVRTLHRHLHTSKKWLHMHLASFLLSS